MDAPRTTASYDARRLLAIGTTAAAVMVAVPVLLEASTAPWLRVGGWGVAWGVFLAAALVALRSTRARPKLGLLGVAVLAVLAMVLLACDGFEGALLVVVALQLGGLVTRAVGVAWVVVQSLLLTGAVAVHWAPKAALLLGPPYLGFALLAFFVADVMGRSERARTALEAANAELSAAQRTIAEHSRLEERVRIARELHDAVGHRLTALAMHLEVALRLTDGDAHETVGVARGLARGALEDVRTVVDRLRDDERIDVAMALRALAAELPAPRVHLSVPDGICKDDPVRAVALLRCAQEIMTNALRHARAANVWIDVSSREGAISVLAKDDGDGAAAYAPGNGLRGMQERVDAVGGTLEIATGLGEGFTLKATLPARRA
jgi:signal transduction histidine kinase